MKFKRIIALVLCLATMFTLVSANVYAADYTVTVKSNDGTETLFTTTVPGNAVITFTSDGFSASSGENYVYNGEKDFLGFHTASGKTVVTHTAGMTYTVTGALTLYLVDVEKHLYTVVGDAVPGATRYELYTKSFDFVLPDEYPYYLMGSKVSTVDGLTYYYVLFSKSESGLKASYSSTSGYTLYSSYNSGQAVAGSSVISLRDAYEQALLKLQNGGSWTVSSVKSFLYGNITGFSSSSGGSSISLPTLNEYEVKYTLLDTSSELHFDMEQYDMDAGINEIFVKAKGEGYYDSDYSNVIEYNHVKKHAVSYECTNATIVDIDGGTAKAGVSDTRPLSVQIKPAAEYLQPDTVTVTMNGSVLTSGYTYDSTTGNLVILSVTGDVVITAQGIRKVAAPVIERDSAAETKDYPLVLTFTSVENAVGYSVYLDGIKISAFETSTEDGIVAMKIKAENFPKSNVYNVYVVAEPAENYTASNPSNIISATVAVQIETPVATAKPDLRTEDYPFVCEVTKPANATALTCYVNGNLCGTVNYEVADNGNWIVYFPSSVFDGSGDYEVYFVAHSGSTDYVESESSNRLTVTISKLATPVIWLE